MANGGRPCFRTSMEEGFPMSVVYRDKIAAFGQPVWYKAKTYKGVKEKEADAKASKDLPAR